MNSLAKIFSYVFHPIFMVIYSLFYFLFFGSFKSFLPIFNPLKMAVIAFIFTALIPCAYILFCYKTGRVSSVEIGEKTERTPIYLLSITSYLICLYLFTQFVPQQAYIFVLAFIGSIFALILTTIINFRWKISAHSCGVAFLNSFVLIDMLSMGSFNTVVISASILIAGLVMSSRLVLQSHTPLQVAAGFVVGVVSASMPFITFVLIK